MNRHERRRLAALTRGRRTGYLHRIAGLELAPGVHIANIEHAPSCAIYRGADCNCVPDISLTGPDRDGVTVIDEDGQCRKAARQ